MTDASTPSSITLRISGLRTESDTSLSGWAAEVYALDGTSRGVGQAVMAESLPPDAVLELELANGMRILVAAADAGRYLGAAVKRGAEDGGAIEVGQVLHLSGSRLPAGVSRDGLGAWILKGLRIYRQGPAAMTALVAAGTFQDATLADRNGLYRCAGERFGLSPQEAMPASAEPCLLFIHGTASSTEGSFGELWRNEKFRVPLVAAYGNRLFAFEHRSLTESPIANALALVKTLPAKARLHLVSHSRGGMVGELLARANRVGSEPFTEDEIAQFGEHAKRAGREGVEADVARLRELNAELRKRAIQVERFVRVACPARGTTLASGRLDRWASVMLNLLGKGFDAAGKAIPGVAPVAVGYGLLKTFLLAVVKQRCDARVLPGIEAMMPDSPLVALLNAPEVTIEPPLHVLAGDFEGDGLLPWLGDCVSEVFYGGETDLVVNTPSMSGGAARLQGIRQKPVCGPQVTHFTYFEREESALALLGALRGDDSGFELLSGPSRAIISRGGRQPMKKADAPIVLMLPGIMGSQIQLHRNRIWFEPRSMWSGAMAQLRINAKNVSADGWLDFYYEDLARYLADSHEVRPFSYDWRLSMVDEAERFGAVLDTAMADAAARGKSLRILAHSMGGLVARLALATRWDAFKAIPGSRLLQLGTPNNGSHSIAAVLMARDDFVQFIERWFDFRHDMREFLEIVRDFPGVLELLPWPGANGLASDGVDYFDAAQWQKWYDEDQDDKKGQCWLPPQAAALAKARAAVLALRAAPLDAERTLYVAGHADTPVAVNVVNGEVKTGSVAQGDGRVSWTSGIPSGVPAWYVRSKHGDLARHRLAFDAYRDLLESGQTSSTALSRTPPVAGTDAPPVFRSRGLTSHALYPSVEEVLAAAVGGARHGSRGAASAVRAVAATVEVIHGSPVSAESPVLIGAYAHDSLRGSASFLDGHMGGQLARCHKMGRYPAQPDDAMVFLHPTPGAKPGGAIVVGLGALGELTPGKLVQALSSGFIDYARSQEQCQRSEDTGAPLAVCGLLVGTGFTGLAIELGMRCMVEALRLANGKLREAGAPKPIARLSLYEESEDRAIAMVLALRDLANDPRFVGAVRFDGGLRSGVGGYRGRCIASGGWPGEYRVLVVADDKCPDTKGNSNGGGLRFTVISDRARNEVAAEADQRQAVDGLIASITRSTQDQPGLSRAMFELMVPNGMKEAVAEVKTLMMSVDPVAAIYPWEMMRDSEQADDKPLVTRVELVRQLASTHGRGRVQTVTTNRVFVVGDTQSGLVELPGAQAEARAVQNAFIGQDYETIPLFKASAQQVYEALFYGRYRFMHLAGHGVVKGEGSAYTGMVLGPNTYLTAAQINQLRNVPEFVFINCCHLGAMNADAQPRWGELAANLATQFIEMGCKAVIAAGWAVDDAAASTFAQSFYRAMLDGKRFGQAVMDARVITYEQHRLSNTWGAFQAYGDERYRFPQTRVHDEDAPDYVHSSHLLADLDRYGARIQSATAKEKKDYYRSRIEAIELAVSRSALRTAGVMEKLGQVWAELDEKDRAIAYYRAALGMEDANLSLKTVEQLANMEIRHGAALREGTDKSKHDAGAEYMDSGRHRIEQLIAIGETSGRLSLLASYWNRMAQVHANGKQRKAVDDSLRQMRNAYWGAAEHSHLSSGEWDYYPLLNALEGDFLIAARSKLPTLGAPHAGTLSSLLQAASANARRRFADDRRLFHTLAEIEAERVDALWASLDGRDSASIVNAEVMDRLVARYCDLLKRLATARERDSVVNQLRFLLLMLPAGDTVRGIKAALTKIADGVSKGAPVQSR